MNMSEVVSDLSVDFRAKIEKALCRAKECVPLAEPYAQKVAGLESAEAIFEFLRDEQVQGVPGNYNSCAIAAYVSNGSGETIGVGQIGVWVEDGMHGVSARVVDSTSAMREFIKKFDNGDYPELVA